MFHSMTILEQLTPLPKSRTIEGRLKLAVNITSKIQNESNQ
jgi:hypothetical protein